MKNLSYLIFLPAIFITSFSFSQNHLEPSTMKKPVDIQPDDSKNLESAIVYLKQGNQKIQIRDFKGAIADYTQALKIKNDFKEALKNRGICYTMLDMDIEAVADFDHAIQIDPEDPASYSYRGFAKGELKEFDAALKDLDKAISMRNNFTDAYMNKGIVYIWMERFDEAVSVFDKIISFDPENGKAYYNKAIALEEKGDVAMACLAWRKSLNLKYRLALEMIGTYCE